MNQLEIAFYKFAYSNRNPIYKLCTRKKPLSQIFGNAYEITYGEKNFNVQYEKGSGGIIWYTRCLICHANQRSGQR